jgi:ribosomal-protein-alanine N-acetyltransferase
LGDVLTDVISLRSMTSADVAAVHRLERVIFPQPWSEGAFLDELEQDGRSYVVAVDHTGEVVGYGGLLYVAGEAHLTTIAVAEGFRSRKLGTRLMLHLIEDALVAGARHLTLEVRMTNQSAQEMYRTFGMAPVGVRQRYYGDEDGLIMWVHDIDQPEYRARLDAIRSGLP